MAELPCLHLVGLFQGLVNQVDAFWKRQHEVEGTIGNGLELGLTPMPGNPDSLVLILVIEPPKANDMPTVLVGDIDLVLETMVRNYYPAVVVGQLCLSFETAFLRVRHLLGLDDLDGFVSVLGPQKRIDQASPLCA